MAMQILFTRAPRCLSVGLIILLLFMTPSFPLDSNVTPDPGRKIGMYFPSSCLYGRNLAGIAFYMESTGLNLAVLHAKDPMGRLFWKSGNPLAKNMRASVSDGAFPGAVKVLKQKGIWTAAKLDVFQDSLLVTHYPELGVLDSVTGELWEDRKGLHWANPYDQRVWDYTLSLCQELISCGVDEIQFDYIRFPSDGDLSTVVYPVILPDTSRAECIGKFLAYARSRLKPSGVLISVDLFGLTAWKTDDFGVGQVLELIAPHVDVICPMLYPSHFPENFLNLEDPGLYPHRIMRSSLEAMQKRTGKEIRPWIQDFWYSPQEISAQITAVSECGIAGWTVWHPSGRYSETFSALADLSGRELPEPEFYPPLKDLRGRSDLVELGRIRIINFTSYQDGYSILSLDEAVGNEKNHYGTLMDIVSTLDESIVDRILTDRGIEFSRWTSRPAKDTHISNLIIQDLDVDPRRMRPDPIYVEWDGDSVFTRAVPLDRLDRYLSQQRDLQ